MSSISINIQVPKDPRAILPMLKKRFQTQIVRRAIREAASPIRDSLRTTAPKDTGTLRKSIWLKVDGKGFRTYGIIGPRRGFVEYIRNKKLRPTKYVRLVDLGSRYISPRNFYAQAFNAGNYRDTIETILTEEVARLLT